MISGSSCPGLLITTPRCVEFPSSVPTLSSVSCNNLAEIPLVTSWKGLSFSREYRLTTKHPERVIFSTRRSLNGRRVLPVRMSTDFWTSALNAASDWHFWHQSPYLNLVHHESSNVPQQSPHAGPLGTGPAPDSHVMPQSETSFGKQAHHNIIQQYTRRAVLPCLMFRRVRLTALRFILKRITTFALTGSLACLPARMYLSICSYAHCSISCIAKFILLLVCGQCSFLTRSLLERSHREQHQTRAMVFDRLAAGGGASSKSVLSVGGFARPPAPRPMIPRERRESTLQGTPVGHEDVATTEVT